MVLSCQQSFRLGQPQILRVRRQKCHCGPVIAKRNSHVCCVSSESRTAELQRSKTVDPSAATWPRVTAAVRAWARAYPNAATSAAVFGTAAISSLLYEQLSSAQLPPLGAAVAVLSEASSLAAVGALTALGAAKLVLGERFHVELHRGRVHIQVGVPSHGPAINSADCITIQPTGDVRGNGAYATAVIPVGSHVGDYSGELLDTSTFFCKYPDGVGDYAMAIDREWVIDAADSVTCTTTFHPVHMNHSRISPNVLRFYSRRQRRVAFFAARDIQPGEQLLYDYGRAYWQGREHLELP